MSIRALAISVSTVACWLTLLPAPAFPQKPAFNLDTGIAPHEVVIPAVLPPFLATVSSSDATSTTNAVRCPRPWHSLRRPGTTPWTSSSSTRSSRTWLRSTQGLLRGTSSGATTRFARSARSTISTVAGPSPGAALGTQIGDSVYTFVDQHIRGAVGPLP